jgi:uncharacterized protein YkwD
MAPTALHHVRRAAAALVASFLLLGIFATVTAAPASATTTPGQDEAGFLTAINVDRTRAGLRALVSDAALAATSRSWSQTMANRGAISHVPDLGAVAQQVEPEWRAIGENVGVGYSVSSLHTAFMNSPGHRANIMAPHYNRVGIGVVKEGERIWVTVRFLQGPAISGSTGLTPPPAPGVRTVLTGDFDGNGYEDVLTYAPGTEADELWFGQASQTMRKGTVSVSGQFRPVAGDFDGNGRTDIFWYAPGSTADYLWQWNGTGWTSTPKTVKGTYLVRTGDFDGDGNDDILWYAPGTAADSRWYGNDNGSFSSVRAVIDGTFKPVVGNLDGTRGDDILWYGRYSNADRIWYSTSQRGGQRSVAATIGGAHSPFTGDFDGNGTDDIVFYTPGSAADSVWFTSTTPGTYAKFPLEVNGTYLPGTGDFDGNHVDDVLWFSPSTASGDPLWWGTRSGGAATSTLRAA